MSLLTHQSFANTDTPYWASANTPTSLVSPLSVIDTYGAPTKKVVVSANTNGTGGVFYANEDGTNPFGVGFAQGITQPGNQIVLDVGNVNPAMTATSSNVVSSLPIVIDSPTNPQNFTILPTPGGVELQQGTPAGGGSAIAMTNAPGGVVGIMGASTFSTSNIIFADKFNNDTTINEKQIQFGNAVGNVAQVGLTGSSAFLGTFTAPVTTPGVLVNISNGCELQFTDALANVYGMKTTTGVLTISAPGNSNAISVAASGQVTIPDIISGSFVPIGGIIMFSGNPATLPANWKVCDGVFPGTPDLTNKFIIGAGTFASGTSGGSATIATSNLPAHNHGVSDPGHNHAITDLGHTHNVVLTGLFSNGDTGSGVVYVGQSLGGSAGNRNSDPNAAQNATTGITINNSTTGITTTNTGGAVAYYPPYYALAYIIRVA
jgi:hypothetical protein